MEALTAELYITIVNFNSVIELEDYSEQVELVEVWVDAPVKFGNVIAMAIKGTMKAASYTMM